MGSSDKTTKKIFASNLKRYMKEHKLTQAQIAKITNVSQQSVSNWLNEKQIPRMGAIEDLASYLHVFKSDLLEDKETADILKNKNTLYSGIKGIIPIPESRQVPMLGAIACGEPIYMDEERGEYYPLDTKIHADFCLRAEGDSMTGARICDGDIVFIQAVPEVENGSIAAVAIDDEATLKYFFQYGDTVVLRPANPKYQEMTYSQDDLNRVRVLGRAVAFQSGL
ncbi:LexA family protein [Dubosiella newyorkensis]|uniref:LexA family protein n=1 Tax=Dubosiella newyorkensis TaxID=1862672 RepID=UPI00272E57A4|nr:S24 family peptidase [Dubosiella newyorkensis]